MLCAIGMILVIAGALSMIGSSSFTSVMLWENTFIPQDRAGPIGCLFVFGTIITMCGMIMYFVERE